MFDGAFVGAISSHPLSRFLIQFNTAATLTMADSKEVGDICFNDHTAIPLFDLGTECLVVC